MPLPPLPERILSPVSKKQVLAKQHHWQCWDDLLIWYLLIIPTDAVCNTPPSTVLEPEDPIHPKCSGDVTGFKIVDAELNKAPIFVSFGDTIAYSSLPDKANIEAIVKSGTSKVSFYSAGKWERDDTEAPFTFSETFYVKKYNDDGSVKETAATELYELLTGGPKYFKAVADDNIVCDVSFLITGAPGKICKPEIRTVHPCEGDKCLPPIGCTLKRGGRGFVFEHWPDVSFANRPDVELQMMIVDSGVVYTFTQSDMVDENNVQISSEVGNEDTFFSLKYTADDVWNQLYNSQYNGGLAFQFVSKNGPGGWNRCEYSPIGMNIFGDSFDDQPGKITGTFTIDIDGNAESGTAGNGDEYLTEWFAPDVGILVHNPPTDGEVSGVHLLGDMGGKYSDGFEKLGKLDTNGNGWIDGDELAALFVWQDKNSNAHLDEGELYTMDQVQIGKIWTQHDCHESIGFFKNGTEFATEDLWFAR